MKSSQVLPEHKARCVDLPDTKNPADGISHSLSNVSLIRRVGISGLLIFSIVVLSGTKACREDYDLGSQTSLVGTPTVTPTATATETDEGVKSFTPTVAVTPTSSTTVSPGPVLTPTPTSAATATAVVSTASLSVRSMLGEVGRSGGQQDVKARMGDVDSAPGGENRNWLGRAYIDDGEASDTWVDSDEDGFSDELEARLDQEGVPYVLPESRLADRVEVYDQDQDGFEDRKEIEQGLSSNLSDTDRDGYLDGLEVLAGSSPLEKKSRPQDADNDGAPDVLEESLGFSVTAEDSDGDRLPDRLEIVLSSDGTVADTDGDGISDGKEVDLGSDPLISDFPLSKP
jgi:hypothetical protein